MRRFQRLAAVGGAVIMVTGAVISFASVSGTSRAGATAPVQFGTLSNFDVFNDTGQETHGFEIELDGIAPTDVISVFGAPYERYGDPTVTAFSGGTMVTYASAYDATNQAWQTGTPLAPSVITPTMGHQCWTGGSATYLTDGCDHFGLGLSATPTNIVYNWLVADPSQPGHLVPPAGGSVAVPAPAFNLTPAPVGAVNQQPVVQAVVNASDNPGDPLLGDAIWAKVYMSESPSKADLGHLVTGDSQVPTTVETDWAILQPGAGGSLAQQLSNEFQINPNDNSVVQRYEYYQYTGAYDPETHEALPVNDSAPVAGDVGNLIGNQMVALNLPGGPAGDTTAPTVSIKTKAPKAPTKATSFKVKFKATDPDSKHFTYYCAIDGAVPAPCVSGVVFSGLGVGAHVVDVYAADQANNASPAKTLTWTVTS